ncbi:exonuclease domain-containing protein [Pseudoalteromonas sp. T1lg23B]|uniref:exonuclease domain-containing protein n=1 Tax=Pseudoalteromonas sp. T1lg23B TaxID=2077097 RepID=UPI000CF665BD|nr:exonuclease domain-containing protein [Pseudoalteromonas sp. T1lg23B]
MQKQLPEKYYLDHYHEFVECITLSNGHLLSAQDKLTLARIEELAEYERCLLVRLLNRKSNFVAFDSLNYAEIDNLEQALKGLRDAQFIGDVAAHDYQAWLSVLTKSQLQDICLSAELANYPIRSAKKAVWLDFTRQHITFTHIEQSMVYKGYLSVKIAPLFDYLLFLFFNRLETNLTQFSMRDLGVMKTHSEVNPASYFSDYQQAQCAFEYARLYQSLGDITLDSAKALSCSLLHRNFDFELQEQASYRQDKLFYKLACLLEQHDQQLSVSLLARCTTSKAQEKRIRLMFSLGAHAQCREQLEAILAEPNDESLLLFAKDFMLRKFQQKRTSILTDLLRESPDSIALEEAYKGNTEQGVIAYYARHGAQSWHCENQLWLALFSIVFWQELYEHELSMAVNEFERYPQLLKFNRFYHVLSHEIEHKLEQINQAPCFKSWLLKQITRYFHQQNALFVWHDDLIEQLFVLAEAAPLDAITSLLRAMSQDFKNLKDGYPDLMVLESNTLRFEEIKAPGDSLRRNQLVSINRLTDSGFDVKIQRTHWQFDPNQTYVVVDIETTGGKSQFDRITEIALVRIERGEIVATWQSLVNPKRSIPKYITQLTGIDNNMVADAPEFSEIADQVTAMCEKAIFVAHNVNFDMGFLKQEFQRLGAVFSKPKLCTVQLARKYLPGHSSYSLGKLCDALGIELKQHHRALEDATAAANILLLINKVRQQEKAQR